MEKVLYLFKAQLLPLWDQRRVKKKKKNGTFNFLEVVNSNHISGSLIHKHYDSWYFPLKYTTSPVGHFGLGEELLQVCFGLYLPSHNLHKFHIIWKLIHPVENLLGSTTCRDRTSSDFSYCRIRALVHKTYAQVSFLFTHSLWWLWSKGLKNSKLFQPLLFYEVKSQAKVENNWISYEKW